jgi:hypothetical protein
MQSMWCFQCGAEYDPGVATCVECGVGLVAEPPVAPEEVGSEDEEQLAYEFHDWSFESRRMLDQLLTGQGIVHSWQGASMIVRASDEDAVDDLVEEVEHATLPTLDPDLEHTVYEMAEWNAEQQTELSNRLGFAGIPHEFDASGDLVVHAEDEHQVDAILDDIELGLSSNGDSAAGGDEEELDGLDVNQLLSELFTASDRLRRSARDPHGVLAMLDHTATLERIRMPFGFERPVWNGIVELARSVSDLLESDDSDDDEIEERAQLLRETLVRLI